MNDREIKEIHNQISILLANRKLKPAFDKIEKLIDENSLGEYRDSYLDLEQTYHLMLKYTLEGINDPERQKIYKHLLSSAFELNDKCRESLLFKFSQSIEYQKKRGFSKLYIEDTGTYFHLLEDYHLQQQLKALVEDSHSD